MDERKASSFDAYHIATATPKDKAILNAEHVYEQIEGTERVDTKDFVEKLDQWICHSFSMGQLGLGGVRSSRHFSKRRAALENMSSLTG